MIQNSNERKPTRLLQITLSARPVCAGCQKNIAAKIISKGGDYLLALKGNQGNVHQAVMDHVIEHMENDFATTTVDRYVETMKGHGREDTVEYRADANYGQLTVSELCCART